MGPGGMESGRGPLGLPGFSGPTGLGCPALGRGVLVRRKAGGLCPLQQDTVLETEGDSWQG